MIILDTHVWVWHIQGDPRLSTDSQNAIKQHETVGLGISSISMWEVAKAVQYGRLSLPVPVKDWLNTAVAYPGVKIIDLTPEIVVESTRLPGNFHKDPADQIIVATARIFDCELLTYDSKILKYKHVKLVS